MCKIDLRFIHFAALAHIVGWVKRNAGTIYVGFAYLIAPQKFEIAAKLANPTRLVADLRLNPTYLYNRSWFQRFMGSKVQRFKGYYRWTLLTILIKIRNARHHPSGERLYNQYENRIPLIQVVWIFSTRNVEP
jgi:hypothetical protein